ncbi:MAG: DUF624 domain-containing protein [Bacilli bacterium]|nr:DUF624 domain-containing protein [Bacilli bacterium]
MNIEKFVNSKIYRFFDWVWRITVLNILTLITSLGIITFLPSITACYKTIYDYTAGEEKNVFSAYFRNLKNNFIRPLEGNIFIIGAAIVFVVALIFYSETSEGVGILTTISVIGFYFVAFAMVLLLLITIQLPMIYTHFNFRYFDNFRFAFYVATKHIASSLGCVLIIALEVLLYIVFVPLWAVTCLSIPILAGHLLFKKTYWMLIHQENQDLMERKDGSNETRN